MNPKREQQEPETTVAPLPGEAPPARKDRIDPESADATSVAPSEGTGLSGNVEPPQDDEPSWMQDA
jgi:hypothetical protein